MCREDHSTEDRVDHCVIIGICVVLDHTKGLHDHGWRVEAKAENHDKQRIKTLGKWPSMINVVCLGKILPFQHSPLLP